MRLQKIAKLTLVCSYTAILMFHSLCAEAQGLNHHFLLGYTTALDMNTTSTKARLLFDATSATLIPESRKMAFRAGQGNISDANGNLLMVSNGCWIANSTGDTMMNGSGLNPGSFTNDWCNSTSGIPYVHSNVFLPWPGDTNKYVLFHLTGNYGIVGSMSSELYYTIIDKSLDNGKGAVIQKNVVAINDTLCYGIAANKHANGRDWWICVLKNNSDAVYTLLLEPSGITNITTQNLNVPPAFFNTAQPVFSPDGTKFAYSFTHYTGTWYKDVRLFDFDRCTGIFSNSVVIDVSDGAAGLSAAFSSNSKYLYTSTWKRVFQINTDTTDILASVQTVALNDSFFSPYPPFQTDFFLMYLAANGKIYISSGNGVIDMHYINYPDSAGLVCDVQQHALHLPCYSGRGNVYHPNYYLGCDTTLGCPCLTTGINEAHSHDFKFSVSPNPTNGFLKIIYLLPQNKSGKLEVMDITGRSVYAMPLPPWSTLQQIDLSFLQNGIYNLMITSANERVSGKVVIVK